MDPHLYSHQLSADWSCLKTTSDDDNDEVDVDDDDDSDDDNDNFGGGGCDKFW